MRISLPENVLRYLFRNTYFINGTAYAGKSTMVKMLAEKYDGICCGENYHTSLMAAINPQDQPNLSYFSTMKDWQEFINRTPDEYDRWITEGSKECADLEIIRLIQLSQREKKMFVDTNISTDMLRHISDEGHIAIMLAPQSTSVERFFDRTDEDKRFILEQIEKAEDPEKTMQNYRACLKKINSPEKYEAFASAGFFTLVRNDSRTPEETMAILEEHFSLLF